MNKPHKHAECIKAWADGAEIEYYEDFLNQWQTSSFPAWCRSIKYRVKPEAVIKKMYMHYDSIENRVHDNHDQVWDGMQVPQQMFCTNSTMGPHLEFTFTDGKLTSVEMKKRTE